MPTYEYACKSCGERLEVVQSFTDEPLTRCPSCKKKQLRKVFGSIGITFKGSGFYKTDSRSGTSSAPSPSTSTDAGSGSGDGASTKEPSTKESSPKESPTKDGAAGKGDSAPGKGKGGATTSTSSGTSAA